MSDVINDVKKNLNNWWKANGPKVEDMLKTTAKKTEELTRKGKLKYDIFQMERSLDKNLSDLGTHVFEKIVKEDSHDLSGDERVTELVAEIRENEKELKELRDKYLEVGKAEDLEHDEDPQEDTGESGEK